MSDRSDRETAELLDELEATLDALREEVDGRGGRRRGPPTPADLLRFTERHTIPTLVATLEATIEALELVRELLRLADPERSDGRARADEAGDRLGRAGESAAAGAERVLGDLRRALAAEELPADSPARDLVAEARDLSAEVEARLREAREDAARRASDDGGVVRIDVTAEGEGSEGDGNEEGEGNVGSEGDEGAEEESEEGAGAEVDVDAELESIRDEVRGDQDETR